MYSIYPIVNKQQTPDHPKHYTFGVRQYPQHNLDKYTLGKKRRTKNLTTHIP